MNKAASERILGPFSTDGLIPHAGAMHLIGDVRWYQQMPIQGEVDAELRGDGPCFGPLGFETHWLIEYCAQASGALYSLAEHPDEHGTPRGFLVTVRYFKLFEGAIFAAGDKLTLRIRFDVQASPLGQTHCQVWRGETQLAEGELTFLLDIDAEG